MGYRQIRVEIEGDSPLMMHNGQLADPLNDSARALAKLNLKPGKKRTETDWEEIYRTEWFGGLYLNKDKQPIIPAEALEACIRDGAKKTRKGKDSTAGVMVDADALVVHNGPSDIDDLYADKRFVDKRGVKIGKARVMRVRPRFDVWSCEFTITYDDSIADQGTVLEWLEEGGRGGLLEWRPKFGRFTVVTSEAVKKAA